MKQQVPAHAHLSLLQVTKTGAVTKQPLFLLPFALAFVRRRRFLLWRSHRSWKRRRWSQKAVKQPFPHRRKALCPAKKNARSLALVHGIAVKNDATASKITNRHRNDFFIGTLLKIDLKGKATDSLVPKFPKGAILCWLSASAPCKCLLSSAY